MKVIYLLGCVAVLAIWCKAVKNEVNEKGKLEVTIGDVLNLLLLTICSWLGVAKALLASNMEAWYNKVIYTFKGGNDETQTDVHSDAD